MKNEVRALQSGVLALAIFAIFSPKAAHACQSGDVRISAPAVSGFSKYVCDTSRPSLGEAWRDESGLIWGDLVTDCSGITDGCRITTLYDGPNAPFSGAEMTFAAAKSYCDRIGARLPTDQEFYRLAYSMGFRDPQTGPDFRPQVLSHTGAYVSLWSQSTYDGEEYGYPGQEIAGLYSAPSIEVSREWIPHQVRCVFGQVSRIMPPL